MRVGWGNLGTDYEFIVYSRILLYAEAMCKPTNTNTSIITHTNPHRDGLLQFTYTLDPTSTAANPALVAMPHYINWSNQLQIRFYKDNLQILQYKDGTLSTLATNNNAPSTLNQTYDATILLDGNHIEVWRGEAGQPQQRILQSDTLTVTRGGVLRFMTLPSTIASFDNVQFTLPEAERTAFAYNKANELRYSHTTGQPPIAYTYDDHGRLTQQSQQTHDGSYQTNYTWLFGDKLKHITSTFPDEAPDVHYLYDGLGRRRNKVHNAGQPNQTITWYRYGSAFTLLSQHDEGTDPATLWDIGDAQKMWYSGGELTGSDPTTATWTYPMRDHLGTPRATYGQTRNLLSKNEYSPYGIPALQLGQPSPIGYTGHYHDPESNLNYAPYRYYNPQTTRWLKRDPLGMIDGPNMYAYVNASPIGQIDLLGGAKSPWHRRGKICTSKSCKGKDLSSVKVLPEDDWSKDNPNWQGMPSPGKCKEADGIAIPDAGMGRKIHGRTTCTLICDECGTKELRCIRRRFWDWMDPTGPISDWPNAFPEL